MAGVYYCARYGCEVDAVTAWALFGLVLAPIVIAGVLAEIIIRKRGKDD